MSFRIHYVVHCDICNKTITCYDFKPSLKQLKEDCKIVLTQKIVVTICNECNDKDEFILKQRIIEVVANDMMSVNK